MLSPTFRASLLIVAALPGYAGTAHAQGFISPGARAMPQAGQRGTVPPPSPAASPPATPVQVPALPSSRLPGALADTLPAPQAIDPDATAAPVQRAALPPSRPVPPAPSLLPAEASLRLRAAVNAAWERSPELAASPGRQAAAAARGRSAGGITPGPPSLGGGFVTDGVGNARGGREAELSVATPLWLPGEGTASRRVADADLSRLTAQQQAQRLAVAGEVREALATVALAGVETAGADARLRDARTLEGDVARRVRGRDAAEAELLTARLDRMEAEIALGERRAALEGARLAFRSLTGMEPDPAALNEPDQPPGVVATHPRVLEAEGAVAAADAARRLTALQRRDSPEVGLLARRSREAGSERYDNRAGFQFRFPFGSEARNAPRQAAAEADLTEAAATATNVRRQVELQAARARVDLVAVRQALGIARERAAVLRQQRALSEAAFRGGQVALGDVIRVRALTTEAEVAQGRADVAVRQARSRVNQALGILP
jgi:cobalt-zinc-cadmium efflux system outer membrane protein